MGRKSRSQLKIPAEMAAEDAYRWKWYQDNNIPPKKMCYWFIYTNSGNIPGGKESDYKYKTRYDAHMKLLKEAFDEDTSLFKLKMTDSMGLGVFARKKLQIVRTDSDSDSDIPTTKLQAKYYNVIENRDWSIGKVTTYNNLGGRPIVGQKRPSSEIKDDMMKDGIKKSLVGPFNFLNHACDAHSQFNLVEDVEQQCVRAIQKTNIHGKKGDQIFINYKEGGIIDYADVDYECASCK
jgi:hypothetical protein